MSQLTDAEVRFRRILSQTCTIQRQSASAGSDLDLVLGALTTVATGVRCLITALKASADLQAVGPLEQDVRQLFLLPDQDVARHDVVTAADGVQWVVTGVPQVFAAREGTAHHIEVLVARKAVQ